MIPLYFLIIYCRGKNAFKRRVLAVIVCDRPPKAPIDMPIDPSRVNCHVSYTAQKYVTIGEVITGKLTLRKKIGGIQTSKILVSFFEQFNA